MRKFLILIFSSFLFFGCASTSTQAPNGYMRTSAPIFLKSKPSKKIAYVHFTNTSDFLDSDLNAVLSNDLRLRDYEITDDEKRAHLVLKGNINYFKRTIIPDVDPFAHRPRFSFGFGFGTGFHHHHHSGFGFGVHDDFWDDDYYPTNSYIYEGQLSLLVRVKNGKNFDDYSTNLDYRSGKNINSKSTINNEFNRKVIQQINLILEN